MLNLWRAWMLAGLLLTFLSPWTEAAVTTPFSVRFTANDTGNTTFAANTLMTASASDPAAQNAQNGVGTKLNNNDFIMTYVDVDTDPSTFNSSISRLNMPAGAQVLFAGLYWGARTNTTFPTGLTSKRPLVKLKAPDDKAYRDLTGTVVGTGGTDYQSFVDVTSIVQAKGAGLYTVANVQAIKDATDYYAGWSLVVVYRAPDEPARNLTVFDGYGVVRSADPSINLDIAGFVSPVNGSVKAMLGFVVYEGDLGSEGDKVFFDGGLGPVQLSDASNPPNNVFNSTIANKGALVSTKSPNYVNQLGFDANLIVADNIIANAASTAKIRMTTGGETYYPGVVTSAIDLYAPKVTVQKTVTDMNGPPVQPGDTLRYSIVVVNAIDSEDAADQVILDDLIPVGTTYKPSSLTIGGIGKSDAVDGDQAEFINGNAVRFQLGTGAGGATPAPIGGSLPINTSSQTAAFDVVVNSNSAPNALILNSATASYVGHTSGFSLKATDAANIAGPTSADLGVVKTGPGGSYTPGSSLQYTMVVTNYGGGSVTGATLLDVMPAEVTGASWTAIYAGGGSGPASGTGDINALLNLPVNGTATFTVTAPTRLEATGNLSNTATVSTPPGVSDPDLSNNTATAFNPVSLPQVDLRITKVVNNASPPVGGLVQFTMSVQNLGPSGATGVVVTDLLPSGFSFVSATSPGGTSYDSRSGFWIVGSLANGATSTLIITATVNPSGDFENTVTISSTDQVDRDLTNNSASVTVNPQSANIAVTKQVDNPSPPVNGTVVFTVVATNQGPSNATAVVVTDLLPSGYHLVSSQPGTLSAYNPITGEWAIPSLEKGNSTTLRLTATVNAQGSYSNTASVTHSDQPDLDAGDNTSTVTTAPISADLNVLKQVDKAEPLVGDTVSFQVIVTNRGPSAATGVVIKDLLPSGFTYLSAAPTAGTQYNQTNGLWTVGSLPNGSSATLRVNATVNPSGIFSNSASVLQSDQADPDTSNNRSDVAVGLQSADLQVQKQVDNPSPTVGGTVHFTIDAINRGPNRATHINLLDILPSGYTFSSAAPSVGAYDPLTGQWTLGSLDNGELARLIITATVNGSGSYENVVSIRHADQPDPDDFNNISRVSTGPMSSDLSVTKEVDNPNPQVGDRVQFMMVITNKGPQAASGVNLMDEIPSGFTPLSAVASIGTSYDGQNGQWTVGSLPLGSSATLRINAMVKPTGTYANRIFISHADQPDPFSGNNASEAVVGPISADLRITKEVDQSNPSVGSPVVFTLKVTNYGPNQASGVALFESLPSGFTLVSATPSGGASYDVASGLWNIGFLANGSTQSLQINATVNGTGSYVNKVSLAHSDQPIPDGNSLESQVAIGPQSADIALTKTVNTQTPAVGSIVEFRVIALNNGPSQANQITVLDNLPSGFSYVSATPSQGTFNPSNGQWTLGTLNNQRSASLVINALVLGSGGYENLATVSYSDVPDPNGSNSQSRISVSPSVSPDPSPAPIPTLNEASRLVMIFALVFLALGYRRLRGAHGRP